MENNEKIVKVYSNNSKKSRLKRNKNKFQRIWDAEKQTYIKVRKEKYPARKPSVAIPKSVEEQMARVKKREENKTKKSVPVNATQMEAKISKLHKSEAKQKPHVVHGKITSAARVEKALTLSLYGGKVNLVWDSNALKYRNAA